MPLVIAKNIKYNEMIKIPGSTETHAKVKQVNKLPARVANPQTLTANANCLSIMV
jgi:hypothetical protein